MQSLSEFLANYINSTSDGHFLVPMVKHQIQDGLEAYKKHLQADNPKTANWAMIEKQLVKALERMEAPAHAEIMAETQANEDKNSAGDLPCVHCGWAMGERVGKPFCDHCNPKGKNPDFSMRN